MNKNFARIISATMTLSMMGCTVGADDETSATELAPVPQEVAVIQAQPYCYGSWRGSIGPYSHYTNFRLGGVLAPGSISAWTNECKTRIKASPQWQSTICVGLAGNWTVQTHVGVRQCFNPNDFSTCLPEIGSGFSTQCSNGVPVG